MNYVVTAQIAYLALAVGITFWVGHILFKHGRIFLLDTFRGNEAFADAVNSLLLMGFYLINIGYAVVTIHVSHDISNAAQVIELTAVRVGRVILVLGGMHFLNLYIFSKMRKRTLISDAPPPIKSQERLAA